ncbi:hypothetical protein HHK36_007820 [Tetracentron sinense]|uniref:Prephenate/arogenate dehydrogenase domain-containing protein n=1 Tax=Tetracentron sinense TaxID=13715 RepID=A0A834ZIE9_TETSI|nr:hypothetical protein HHK36_007820 [Tetracentron sinense]
MVRTLTTKRFNGRAIVEDVGMRLWHHQSETGTMVRKKRAGEESYTVCRRLPSFGLVAGLQESLREDVREKRIADSFRVCEKAFERRNLSVFVRKPLREETFQEERTIGVKAFTLAVLGERKGVSFFSNLDDLCKEHPEVILLCTSIISTESVLRSLPVHRLKRNSLFVDVLSVKEFPRNLFLQILPPEFDILCTHPMFGPESGKNGWKGLIFVYDKVRVGSEESRVSRCDRFLNIFAHEGCRMVKMSCAEHDRNAAGLQFITHTMGRILEKLRLDSTQINTKGYETLLNLVENTSRDSFDLYYGLFMYDKNAMEQLERLDMAFESLKKQLFGHLHDVIRKQLFENAESFEVSHEEPMLPKLLQNGAAVEPPSETMR